MTLVERLFSGGFSQVINTDSVVGLTNTGCDACTKEEFVGNAVTLAYLWRPGHLAEADQWTSWSTSLLCTPVRSTHTHIAMSSSHRVTTAIPVW